MLTRVSWLIHVNTNSRVLRLNGIKKIAYSFQIKGSFRYNRDLPEIVCDCPIDRACGSYRHLRTTTYLWHPQARHFHISFYRYLYRQLRLLMGRHVVHIRTLAPKFLSPISDWVTRATCLQLPAISFFPYLFSIGG